MMCTYLLAEMKMWKIQFTGKHHGGLGVIRLAGQDQEQRHALPLHLGQALLPPWQYQHSPRHLQPAGRGHGAQGQCLHIPRQHLKVRIDQLMYPSSFCKRFQRKMVWWGAAKRHNYLSMKYQNQLLQICNELIESISVHYSANYNNKISGNIHSSLDFGHQ